MGSFPGARSADADGFDEVQFGSSRPPGHRPPGRLLIAAGATVIAVIAVVSVAVSGHQHTPHAASVARPTVRPAPPMVLPTATVTQAGHRLLGVTAGWELLGYGPGQVVRIEFARGRIVRTPVPPLLSTGPVSFVVGPRQVIIRPLDLVPGYLVRDGHPARALSGVLSHGGTLIPGPRPGTAWYQSGYQAGSLSLVQMDGTRTGTSMSLPRGGAQVIPDGRGYALALGVHSGVLYDVGPQGVRRITGTLAAVGPAGWLTVRCRHHLRCSDVVVNPATGARHVLPGRVASPAVAPPAIGAPGVIAPDGSAAALLRAGPGGGQVTLYLVNLMDGSDHRIDLSLNLGSAGAQTLAWSPDSRWLFAVAANGTLAVVNARTYTIENIGVKIPSVSEIAIRNSPNASQSNPVGG